MKLHFNNALCTDRVVSRRRPKQEHGGKGVRNVQQRVPPERPPHPHARDPVGHLQGRHAPGHRKDGRARRHQGPLRQRRPGRLHHHPAQGAGRVHEREAPLRQVYHPVPRRQRHVVLRDHRRQVLPRRHHPRQEAQDLRRRPTHDGLRLSRVWLPARRNLCPPCRDAPSHRSCREPQRYLSITPTLLFIYLLVFFFLYFF